MQIIDNESFSHIISWTPDGSSFTIHKPLAFEKEVLCLTFDPTPQGGIKLQSFLRKVRSRVLVVVVASSTLLEICPEDFDLVSLLFVWLLILSNTMMI